MTKVDFVEIIPGFKPKNGESTYFFKLGSRYGYVTDTALILQEAGKVIGTRKVDSKEEGFDIVAKYLNCKIGKIIPAKLEVSLKPFKKKEDE